MLSKLKKLFKSKKRRNVVKKKTIKKLKKKVLKKKKAMRIAKKPAAQEELVGIVTHYFPHVKAGVIKIKKGTIALGDTIHIKGHTTDFRQKVTSLQIDREPITSAPKGKEIGLAVKSRVRHNDKVFKAK